MNISIPMWLQEKLSADCALSAGLLWQRRNDYQALFKKNGLPTRSDERWKYTDLSFLAKQNFHTITNHDYDHLSQAIKQHKLQHGQSFLFVFINGHFMPAFSDLESLPQGVVACSLQEALTKHPDLLQTYWPDNAATPLFHGSPFANLNIACLQEGLFFALQEGCELTQPVHLLSIVTEKECIAHPFLILGLGKRSQLTLVEDHFSSVDEAYMMNHLKIVTLEKEARLHVYKIQKEGKKAVHIANTFVYQKEDSLAQFHHFTSGGIFSRDDLIVKLQGTGADCRTAGFYRTYYEGQYVDHHIDIEHLAERTHSEMLFKGIVDNKSRAVFNGRLHVANAAQKTTAFQGNHNLLLSNQAEIYSKPELEIYADDVKCKHGATTGQLDEEALFYLRARGIPREEAIQLLLQGFAEEILQSITHQGIKMRVQEWL